MSNGLSCLRSWNLEDSIKNIRNHKAWSIHDFEFLFLISQEFSHLLLVQFVLNILKLDIIGVNFSFYLTYDPINLRREVYNVLRKELNCLFQAEKCRHMLYNTLKTPHCILQWYILFFCLIFIQYFLNLLVHEGKNGFGQLLPLRIRGLIF